jgi:hypothetical protein
VQLRDAQRLGREIDAEDLGAARAIESERMPPPQPTSTTRLPSSAARPSIQSRRSGLMSCSGRKSPSLSHHWCARSLNLAELRADLR